METNDKYLILSVSIEPKFMQRLTEEAKQDPKIAKSKLGVQIARGAKEVLERVWLDIEMSLARKTKPLGRIKTKKKGEIDQKQG